MSPHPVIALLADIRSKLDELERRMAGNMSRPITGRSVDELWLSNRSLNCLKNADILTIDELTTQRSNDLMRLPNFGKKCLAEVREELTKHGLHLRGEAQN